MQYLRAADDWYITRYDAAKWMSAMFRGNGPGWPGRGRREDQRVAAVPFRGNDWSRSSAVCGLWCRSLFGLFVVAPLDVRGPAFPARGFDAAWP